ncbi:MAG: hypothetical protein HZT40_04025 [Candidatus Thiothrix singaporensis]|uniref:Uncharacterized protein n=1 Tax=Candidatus Thiothrix singaporensis TaxID=2799669 RepID=A0A7L6APD7_9GAMM|nr:MAG: hypothetical protein HZT40_04025 [Candidatus Thiothrix singaporensis]
MDEDGRILDFTTFTFRRMIASLDKIEGVKKKTGVTWCPDYLYTKKGECSSLYAVSNGRRDKMFYYKPYEDQNYKPSLTDDDNLEALVEGLKARGNTVKVMSYDEFLRSGYTLHPS